MVTTAQKESDHHGPQEVTNQAVEVTENRNKSTKNTDTPLEGQGTNEAFWCSEEVQFVEEQEEADRQMVQDEVQSGEQSDGHEEDGEDDADVPRFDQQEKNPVSSPSALTVAPVSMF